VPCVNCLRVCNCHTRIKTTSVIVARRVTKEFAQSILRCVVPIDEVRCCTIALLCHNVLSYWSTLSALLSDSGKLFANVYHFSRAALRFNQRHSFREVAHPLTFMLQKFDAGALRCRHRLQLGLPDGFSKNTGLFVKSARYKLFRY